MERPMLVLGIRYGLSTVMLGFASGIWMAIVQSRINSQGGSLMSIHFLAFHALQAIPLIAWLLERTRLSNSRIKQIVHATGGSWLLAVGCATLQAYMGNSPLHLTFFSVLGLISLLLWFSILVYAVVSFLKARGSRSTGFSWVSDQ